MLWVRCRETRARADVGRQCPYEWFHLECLGLKTEKNLPKLWYCPECRVSLGMDGDGREGGKRTSKR